MSKFLSQEAIDALQYRISQEEFSSRLYQDMHLWFEDKGYLNLAKLYQNYADEEWEHAGWSKKFLLSFDIKPKLEEIESPESSYESCYDILEATVIHEEEIARQCQEMATDALKRSEVMLYDLAMKYCHEQIDELDKSYTILNIAKMTTDLLVFDNYIGTHYLA